MMDKGNVRNQNAKRHAVCCLLIAVLLAALGGCRNGVSHLDSRRECNSQDLVVDFTAALNRCNLIGTPSDAVWLLEWDNETEMGKAWVGEVRNEILYVFDIECSSNPFALRVTAHGQYPHFTGPRKAALVKVFTMKTELVDGRDRPASSVESFSGHGDTFVETVTLNSELDINHLSKWIDDVGARACVERDIDLVPVELVLPWIVARYYAAGR